MVLGQVTSSIHFMSMDRLSTEALWLQAQLSIDTFNHIDNVKISFLQMYSQQHTSVRNRRLQRNPHGHSFWSLEVRAVALADMMNMYVDYLKGREPLRDALYVHLSKYVEVFQDYQARAEQERAQQATTTSQTR